jgi:hypothetical protein
MSYDEQPNLPPLSTAHLEPTDPGPAALRPPWSAPVVTRLSVERTLLGVGSGGDGLSHSTSA